jgi:hypothetical protein
MRNLALDRDVVRRGMSVWKIRPTMADFGMGKRNDGPIKAGFTLARPPRSVEKTNGCTSSGLSKRFPYQ